MIRNYFFILILIITAAPIAAQVKDPVVVKQGKVQLTMSEIDARVNGLPKEHRAGFMDSPERIEQMLQTLLLEKQLAYEGRERGLDRDPLFEKEVEQAANQLIAQHRMNQFVETLVIPDMEKLAHERYIAEPQKYAVPERLDLTHILIKVEGRTEEAAHTIAEEVHSKAISGETPFSELVAKYTEERKSGGSASNGRLPNVQRGIMVPEFEQAAFALRKEGDISPVVKTPYGYHVIRLNKRTPAIQHTFDQVKEKIISELRESYIAEQKQHHIDVLRNIPLDADPNLVASLRTRYLPKKSQETGNSEVAPPKAGQPPVTPATK